MKNKNDIENLFNNNVSEYIKTEIENNNGNEVFFVASLEKNNFTIETIEAFARGNEEAVPVLFDAAYNSDLIIHNHPSGDLTPSNQDINIAAQLGNMGIGFYIVNNDVTNINEVVKAINKNEISKIDIRKISSVISENGKISQLLNNYEYRKSQEEMLIEVAQCFNNNNIGLIEAGTGTGKSLAYLIPSIMWSLQNKEKIVISTNTINLQEQLIKKDIPFLKRIFKDDFKAILVKGSHHYICLRKLQVLMDELQLDTLEENEKAFVENLKNWINHSPKDGCKDEFDTSTENYLWEKVAVETDICTRTKCKFYNECYFYKARKQMVDANLLIVNHHILFSDISIRKQKNNYEEIALLPRYNKIIIDEAHNLEDSAQSYFENQVTRIGFKRILSKYYKGKKNNSNKKGSLTTLNFKLKLYNKKNKVLIEPIISRIEKDIKNILIKIPDIIDEFFDHLFEYTIVKLKSEKETVLRLREQILSDTLFEYTKNSCKKLENELSDLINHLYNTYNDISDLPMRIKEEMIVETKELSAFTGRMSQIHDCVHKLLNINDDGELVYWTEIKNQTNTDIIKLVISPINISNLLAESLFTPFESIILTSATLSINGNFQFNKSQLGIDEVSNKKIIERILKSPFDYENNSSICVPNDIVEPQNNKFIDIANEYILKIIRRTKGSTFILFTSFYHLNKCKEYLREQEFDFDIELFVQGEKDRANLLNFFRDSNNGILLGTDSFWEGVDVSGDALRCVIIVKLPFKVPNTPLQEARYEEIEKKNMNPFTTLSLPQSIIKFKQGFGRLIRTKEDYGLVLCLDIRLLTKFYGKLFVNSLPPVRKIAGNIDDISSEVKRYF